MAETYPRQVEVCDHAPV